MTNRSIHTVRDSLEPSLIESSIGSSSGDCLSPIDRLSGDSSSRLAATSAVARGTLLLSLLTRQAAAARAEAQCTELRLLLGEAREGESLPLQRWLQAHAAENPLAAGADGQKKDDSILGFEASPTSTFRSNSTNTANSTSTSSKAPIKAFNASSLSGASSADTVAQPHLLDSWETLLAPAHARLLGHAQRLRGQKLRDQHVRDQQTHHVPRQNTPPQHKQVQHKPQLFVARTRGVVASMGAHGVLILLLAWITLRLPTPPASLALEASPVEWTPEAMEISQPMELSQPDSADVSYPTNAPFDLSETLTEVASNVGAALGELPVSTTSSLPNGNMLAASASASKLMHGNATFYGAAASGNCFCYIIDGSGSMRNGPWDAAKLELLKSLATLKEKQRFYIIFFNYELSAIPLPGEQTPAPTPLYATPDNLTHTRRWLDTLRIDRGGPPNDALDLAISKEPDAIYLLTDGVTTVDVPNFLRASNRITDLIFGEQVRVPIHTIAFYSLDGQAMLKQIAAENDGQFIYVPNPRKK
ncbi:MAG: vWA domain-containing protein [Aureliella sp.]